LSSYIPEKIIKPEDFTIEIIETINVLKYRMRQTCAKFQESDIIVVEYDDVVFVLANPILGWDVVERGCEGCLHEWNIQGDERACNLCGETYLARHNITLVYWDKSRVDSASLEFAGTMPRLEILRPDLCFRIEMDGAITGGKL